MRSKLDSGGIGCGTVSPLTSSAARADPVAASLPLCRRAAGDISDAAAQGCVAPIHPCLHRVLLRKDVWHPFTLVCIVCSLPPVHAAVLDTPTNLREAHHGRCASGIRILGIAGASFQNATVTSSGCRWAAGQFQTSVCFGTRTYARRPFVSL
eukprot:365681-Chlamydomonas_euryale.AAC.8